MPRTEEEILEDYKKATSSLNRFMIQMADNSVRTIAPFAKLVEKIGEIDARSGSDSVRDPETMAKGQETELHD